MKKCRVVAGRKTKGVRIAAGAWLGAPLTASVAASGNPPAESGQNLGDLSIEHLTNEPVTSVATVRYGGKTGDSIFCRTYVNYFNRGGLVEATRLIRKQERESVGTSPGKAPVHITSPGSS